ncbi:GntR family transcriptional regulator [Streptomyces sp. SID8350]|nr:GntR family transcriptional regulator [Streptomyces sp. SID8350]
MGREDHAPAARGRGIPPGTHIPPLRELHEEFAVSIGTVRFGLAPLIRAGYIVTQSFNQQGKAITYRASEVGTVATEAVTNADRTELLRPEHREGLPPNGKFTAWG